MSRILYQNSRTGDAFDVTGLVTSAKWSTKRSGAPASLEITALDGGGAGVEWEHGGVLTLLSGGGGPKGADGTEGAEGLFYGYVVKISRSEKEQVSVTAYDQIWYLKKNKETYVFENQRADQILSQIGEDFGLTVGELENTGYAIPSMVEDGQTLLDILLKALDYTIVNTGRMYVLWDDYGSLRLTEPSGAKLDLVVGDGSLATGYSYESEIDSQTYNRIKLAQNNKTTGKRDIYLYQDSDTIRLWGTLQDYEVVDEKMEPSQIITRAQQMLELYNRPKKSFEVSALGDLSVRAGRGLFLRIADLGVSSFYIVEEASHDLLKETMSLKLKVV